MFKRGEIHLYRWKLLGASDIGPTIVMIPSWSGLIVYWIRTFVSDCPYCLREFLWLLVMCYTRGRCRLWGWRPMRCLVVLIIFASSQNVPEYSMGSVERFVEEIIDSYPLLSNALLTAPQLWKLFPSKVKMWLLFVFLSVAFYTLLERKLLAYMQGRKGPNKPGPIGVMVPFADALKLVKESNYPLERNIIFVFMPFLFLRVPLLLWVVYPTPYSCLVFKSSILWVVCVSSVGVYAVLGSGWRSNRKYAIYGAVRAVAQSISYEVLFVLILLHWMLYYNYDIISSSLSNLLFLFIMMCLFFIVSLAETNRAPFDFVEGESELVRGFNTEFRGVSFLMIFLAEYMSILFISLLISVLFNITFYADLFIFFSLWAVSFIWCRGTLPRLRYDHLIYLAWKNLLSFLLCSLGVVVIA